MCLYYEVEHRWAKFIRWMRFLFEHLHLRCVRKYLILLTYKFYFLYLSQAKIKKTLVHKDMRWRLHLFGILQINRTGCPDPNGRRLSYEQKHWWSQRTREQHCRAREGLRVTIGRFCWNVNCERWKIPWNHTLHGPNTTRVRVEAKTIKIRKAPDRVTASPRV